MGDSWNGQRKAFEQSDITVPREPPLTTAIERSVPDTACLLMESVVANAAFEMATSKKSPALTIYWLKIHGGPEWRQDQNYGVEHSGEVQHNVVDERKKQLEAMRNLTDEQLAELREHRQAIAAIMETAKRPAIETTAQEQGDD